jgi:transposase
LRPVAEPDAIIEHAAERCAHCQARLSPDSKIGEEKRQVFDLPQKPLIVTERRGDPRLPGLRPTHARRLPPRASFRRPNMASGSGRRASISTLSQLAPEERTAQVLADLFGATAACGASVAARVRRKAEALAEAYRRIGGFVAAAPVRCLDETGFRRTRS